MPTFTIVPPDAHLRAKIKIVGVGGGGCNALESLMGRNLSGVDFVAVNTDSQDLKISKAYVKLQIGNIATRGLGTGAVPSVGEDAAIEDKARITEVLDGSDMVFITACMGGGTGTGASPVVAKVSKEVGALTVAIVTMPFTVEGKFKSDQAVEGLSKLEKEADTLIVVPNDNLLGLGENSIPVQEAFDKANDVLFRAVSGITEIINTSGRINTDFADVRTIMSQSGSKAIMGTGSAEGADRAVKAAETAVESPLLGALSIEGAEGVLLNIVSPPDFTMDELEKVCDYVRQKASEHVNLIFGWTVDDNADGEVKITIIATGVRDTSRPAATAAPLPGKKNGTAGDDKSPNLFSPKGSPAPPDPNDLDIPAYLREKSPESAGGD